MFEMPVEDAFAITGVGTILLGRIRSGTLAVGDPLLIKFRSTEIRDRCVGVSLKESLVQKAEQGTDVGVHCRKLKLTDLADCWEVQGDQRRLVGVTLEFDPIKRRWWQP